MIHSDTRRRFGKALLMLAFKSNFMGIR
ncbi:hypothetical protein RHIZ404_210325 [Rhizobium sp. EC-SD404]|nr:hypothetical protein RHIZ404_210325 [Rhizobium sp. EC-SD404]